MRFPRRKIYRAFPELDRFTDAQCKLLLQRVKNTRTYHALLVLAVLVFALGMLVVGVTVVFVFGQDVYRFFWTKMGYQTAEFLHTAFGVVLVCGGPPMITLIVRDLVLRRYVRWAIGMRFDRIRCLRCRYSMLGQRAVGEVVVCPECGRTMTLSELGVESAADLIPGLSSVTESESPGRVVG